ncbi:hypothetical protein Athai_08020 [Actinocatenispora thailandica]|uniref:Uncharacterized protein n=1 Tax=Actinocatenispora thailandica TaxID=227318 RepID=A0A7R7DKB2_9ACTN|nr:hypothetical protein Athai_08020 [Actinocatenispora thailandica]
MHQRVRVQREQPEYGSLPGRAEPDRPATDPQLQRAQHAQDEPAGGRGPGRRGAGKPRAAPSRRAVLRRGVRRRPCSRSRTAPTLSPARSASSRWLSRAVVR